MYSYIYTHPKASWFWKRGCEHYKLQGLIFNKSIATRIFHHASTLNPSDTNDNIKLENQFLHLDTYVDLDVDSNSYSDHRKWTGTTSAKYRIR